MRNAIELAVGGERLSADMSTEFAAITSAVETAASAWHRRGVPFEREELVQQGWEIALRSLPAARRTGDALGPYLCAAVIRSLGRYLAEWSAACSVSKHRRPMISGAAPINLRCPVSNRTRDQEAGPEAQAIDFDSLTHVRAEFERLIGEMRSEDQRIIRHLAATGDDPGKATEAVGVPVQRIYKAKRAFVVKARADERLRAVVG